jgi:hypothetical protein
VNRSRLYSILAAALIVAILVLGWLGAVSPQLTQIASDRDQTSQVDAQNLVLSQALANLKSQSDDLPKLTSELAALREKVPDTADVDTFVHELQTLANANGVVITNIVAAEAVAYPAVAATTGSTTGSSTGSATGSTSSIPAPTATPTPVPTTLTAPTPTTSSTDVQPSAALRANLYTIDLTMSLSGPGAGILSFVQAVQNGSRLFLVTTTSLTTQAPDALGTASIGGYIFVVTSPAQIAARAAAATAKPTATPTPIATPTPTPTVTPTPTATSTPTPAVTPTRSPAP